MMAGTKMGRRGKWKVHHLPGQDQESTAAKPTRTSDK